VAKTQGVGDLVGMAMCAFFQFVSAKGSQSKFRRRFSLAAHHPVMGGPRLGKGMDFVHRSDAVQFAEAPAACPTGAIVERISRRHVAVR
jgi:hypothetical protein